MKLRALATKPSAQHHPECITCTQPHDDDGIIAFTDNFKIILHPNQSSIGSVLIATRRHVGRICDFNVDESGEFITLFSTLEPVLESAFGAALLNMDYQRNWAFRQENPDPPFFEGRPNPHVHFHVVPRYSKPVRFRGNIWEDMNFGEPFIWSNIITLDGETKDAIINTIQSKLDLIYE